ncbi:hypothetical protein [Saccharothrix sp. Mg75]|uniref:hypothetical protein n=1 Tax=Saccharothrix sp. Mg75 TaxID=3445357 RepID=UPI003EE88397
MTDLAAFPGLDESTMSGLVERAERRGLVARDRSPADRLGADDRHLLARLLGTVSGTSTVDEEPTGPAGRPL